MKKHVWFFFSLIVFNSFSSHSLAFPTLLDVDELDGVDGFTINGVTVNQAMGYQVSSAGDVNNDGYDDVIIGSFGSLDGEPAAFVVFGSASASATLELSTLSATAGFGIKNSNTGNAFALAVDGVGDINNDGYDDLIVGHPYSLLTQRRGESFVIFGGANLGQNGPIDVSQLSGVDGFVISGGLRQLGFSVSAAGDFNNDTYDDFIVGSVGISSTPESYLLFGGQTVGSTGSVDVSLLTGIDGFKITGNSYFEQFGAAVSGLGDVNGDGFTDVAVTASAAGIGGESYVIFGGNSVGAGGLFDVSTLSGTNGFVVQGSFAGGKAGTRIAGGGDVNGDGFDDIVVGAPLVIAPGTTGRSGESYVIFGSSTIGDSGTFDLSSLTGQNGFVIFGAVSSSSGLGMGNAVSGAGDFNNDGYADLLFGVSEENADNKGRAGVTYVVFGSSQIGQKGFIYPATLDGMNGFFINGNQVAGRLGSSVSNAGDMNNDGFDDIIASATGVNANGVGAAGASYVIYGSSGETGAGQPPVSLASSCLAGLGRVDMNIANKTSTQFYDFYFQGQGQRTRFIRNNEWGRFSITRRQPGTYQVSTSRNGNRIWADTIQIDCAFTQPPISSSEITIVNTCAGGNGLVLFQMVNPTNNERPYVIEFENLPNRSTTAAAYGQAVRGVSGRPDGEYDYVVRTGSTILNEGTVKVDCDS